MSRLDGGRMDRPDETRMDWPDETRTRRTPLLLIGGLDPTGQAGLARDIAVCADEKVHPCPVASAVTVQTSEGFDDAGAVRADRLARQAEAAIEEHRPSWAKVGMLASADQVDAVARLAADHGLRLVVDPVLATSSGTRVLDDAGVAALRRLVGQAELVTPNLAEAQRLTGLEGAEETARELVARGARTALVTQGGEGPDILFDATRAYDIHPDRAPGRHRGTGCRLATRIACHLARGMDTVRACRLATRTLHGELAADAEEQALHGPRLQHFLELESWLPRIVAAIRHEDVPEVGMNVAYALPGATDPRRDVLGLAGRITIAGFGLGVTGRLRYGGPHHTGRIAVVLQEHDAWARIVMNHRFGDVYLDNARAAGLVDVGFRREDEPQDAPSSMEWGVRHCIDQNDGRVPDLVWDRGGIGKEAMIRVVADGPEGLVRKLDAMHGGLPSMPERGARAPSAVAWAPLGLTGGQGRRHTKA